MKRYLLITLTVLALSAGYSYADTGSGGSTAPGYGGNMMGSSMMGSAAGEAVSPETAPGYGNGMMGSGMMGQGYGQSPCMMGSGMMGSGMMGGNMMGGNMMGGNMMGGNMMGGGMMGGGMMGGGMMGGGMMGGNMMGGSMMGSGMMGSGMMNFDMMGYGSEEEQESLLDSTVDLRRDMNNKTFELSEAMRKSDTTLDTILKLKKDMLQIKVKIYEKALNK